MKSNKKIFNFSITAKIILSFCILFVFFAFFSIISFQDLKDEKEIIDSVSELTESSARVLDISREIAEIQKLVSVYGQIGGKSVIKKIEKNHSILSKILVEVRSMSKSETRKEEISSMIAVLKSYGESIQALESRYEKRERFINKELPKVITSGLSFFNERITYAKKRKNSVEVILYQGLKNNWYAASHNASLFLNKKNYQYRLNIETIIREMKLAPIKVESLKQEMNKYLERFYLTFDNAVQANRIYLSLVNVVMAGDAIEFTVLSKKLREDTIKDLQILINTSDDIFKKNRRFLLILLGLMIPLLIAIGAFFKINIANGIKDISKIFEQFIKGDLELNIPGLNRKDEIGRLAQAASSFRDISLEFRKEKAKAEELSKSKTRFLATMSHEIRTPMNAILSCAYLLTDEIRDKGHLKLLSTIQTSGDTLLVLINDILDFSKIDFGKMVLEKISFSPKNCVESVFDLFSAEASKKEILIETKYEGDVLTPVLGDTTRLRQILVNFVSNGLKFTKSRICIETKARRLDDKKVELTFSVIDDGIGIDEEGQKLLFQEFSQVDASTTRKYGGTGLGLAICRGIVKAMNGDISVVSEVGKGSKFSFTIIAEISNEQSEIPRSNKISAIDSKMGTAYPLKILMAEDNSMNQMVVRKMLEKFGYTVDIVSNGSEAVEIVQENQYDLIFMDQHMPVMDGVDAATEIRSLDIKQPQIFALTASTFQEDRDRCLEVGMNGFLTKPIMVDELRSALKKVCQMPT